ncbi:hypothetical protein O1611_g7414 [Lasiodiplodia mahajangana]|uniref:Uncharacterized protein n=1 Tax=Lasiodiplodia mahajangana TaxID=1108764 RepID=A0ACC2JG73_9PEZI|nr:hypothetical protein O1611_g7414 [Lasiodiplodia mahajangana]
MSRQPINGAPERCISLLSLDGGGVRGLWSLVILQRIMEGINPDDPPKSCDYFDMICGTSTGGLIAIMLGRLKMSVAECIEEYKSLSAKVFTKRRHRLGRRANIQGRFDHVALEASIKDLLRKRGLNDDELLKEPDADPQCKTFVCTMSQETSGTIVFPSYYSPTWGKQMLNRVRIWEAARATSAATSFFEPIAIDGRVYTDGATGANNPIHELWAEASSMYSPDDKWKLEDYLKCLVSIGTGIPSRKPFGPGLIQVAAALKAIATGSEEKAEQFLRQHPSLVKKSILFRFNVVDGLQEVGLEAASRLGEIEASTYRYCASVPIAERIADCASKLKDKPWVTEAVLTFDRLFKNHSIISSYSSPLGHSPRPEIGPFTHTIAFQQWLCDRKHSLICAAPTDKILMHDPASLQNQLAASLSRYSEARSNCVVVYMNCFSLLQTPKQSRLETLASELRREGTLTDSDGDGTSDAIMQSLCCQLFKLCNSREEQLRDYDTSLSEKDSYDFRGHITGKGVPRKQDLLQLTSRLLNCSTRHGIISIDCLHFLAESAQNNLVSNLIALKAQRSFKSILCGDESLLARNITAHYTIISINTEIQECLASLSFEEINVRKSQVAPAAEGTTSWIWSHPVYQAFSTHDAGILWIRGKPGSGKSVLARSIQKKIRESLITEADCTTPPLIGDWFYHRRRGGYFRHESFIRSIIYHFLQQDSNFFRKFLQDPYRQMDPQQEKVTWTYELLVSILKKVCAASTPMLIVVDAIDEAENVEVLRLIKSIVSETPHSKSRFILLSRPTIPVEREIEGEPTIIVENENQKDIERIIEIGLALLQNSIHSLDFGSRNKYPNRRYLFTHRQTHQPRPRSLVTITAEQEKQTMHQIDTNVKHTIWFNEWSKFLDVVCGSKRPSFTAVTNVTTQSRASDRLEEEDDDTESGPEIPIADIEDAIIMILTLGS